MASSIPDQDRMVDPFASYNSNEVNRLTEMVGLGENGIITYPSLQVSVNDSTSVIVSEGYVLKDDVLIKITSPHIVSFYDADHYTDPTPPIPESGYNYIVLDYTYVKSRPAPKASIKILKNSDRHLYTSASNLYLLQVVHIIELTPNNYEISGVFDYDPDTPTNQREGVKTFTGAKFDIPTHTSGDQGRTLYSSEEDDFAFGLSNRWIRLQDLATTGVTKDTMLLAKGDLVYFNSIGGVSKAISTMARSTADGVVTIVGSMYDNPPGKIETAGKVEDVPIQSGVVLNVGDLLYLSLTEAGKVTNIEVYPFTQFVGRCLEKTGGGTTCTMLFVRGYISSSTSAEDAVGFSETLTVGNWIYDGGLKAYYQDIDISSLLDPNALVSARDTTSDLIIEPYLVDFQDSTSEVRIWMPDATTELDITIVGRKGTAGKVELVRDTLAGGFWLASGGRYYQDVDITTIGTKNVVVELYDDIDDKRIKPDDLELVNANTLRVWMEDSTSTLNLTAIGPNVASPNTYSGMRVSLQDTAWVASGGSYYQDIGIVILNEKDVLINVKDSSNGEKIEPEDIEFLNTTSVRIWMPDDTKTLEVLVVG